MKIGDTFTVKKVVTEDMTAARAAPFPAQARRPKRFIYALSSIPRLESPFKILFITEVTSFSSRVWSLARKVME